MYLERILHTRMKVRAQIALSYAHACISIRIHGKCANTLLKLHTPDVLLWIDVSLTHHTHRCDEAQSPVMYK